MISRYPHPYRCVHFDRLPDGASAEPVVLEAADGGLGNALLYTPGSPSSVSPRNGGEENARQRTVVCFMHPRADMSRHYAIPMLLEAGYAAFGQNSRWLNNDATCVHETLLLDVAAGIRFLRERGFENVVLVGNSGGGSLYGFYLAQASTAPPGRLTNTAAGDRLDLNAHDLPPADGLVLLAAHLGEGRVLQDMIDPSVTDENDPLSSNPGLDPYRPENGYRPPPASSSYSADFVARYRQAQKERVAHIDAIARKALEERREARRETRTQSFAARPWEEQAELTRMAIHMPYMVVYRTEADLRSLDLSLDASERDAGTLFSYRPDLTNYSEFGFARVVTPRAWLSTWSALSSRADLLANARRVSLPSLVVSYRGDNGIFPSDAQAAFDALGSPDKTFEVAPGDHYGYASGTQDRTGAPVALEKMIRWLQPRFAP